MTRPLRLLLQGALHIVSVRMMAGCSHKCCISLTAADAVDHSRLPSVFLETSCVLQSVQQLCSLWQELRVPHIGRPSAKFSSAARAAGSRPAGDLLFLPTFDILPLARFVSNP